MALPPNFPNSLLPSLTPDEVREIVYMLQRSRKGDASGDVHDAQTYSTAGLPWRPSDGVLTNKADTARQAEAIRRKAEAMRAYEAQNEAREQRDRLRRSLELLVPEKRLAFANAIQTELERSLLTASEKELVLSAALRGDVMTVAEYRPFMDYGEVVAIATMLR